MRYPYLFDDVNVLKNLASIKDADLLQKAETDITNITMSCVYNFKYTKFNIDTLCNIHKTIFGLIYEWAGQFRTIQMVKYETLLGGHSVLYSHPKDIKKELDSTMKEINKLKVTASNKHDIVFILTRIVAAIWKIHPFREGNTRTVIAFTVLLAKHLGFEINYSILKENASYVRNSLVMASNGIYSKFEYLERIFFDAILHENIDDLDIEKNKISKYETIGNYNIKDYKEQPHEYKK